MSRKHRRVSVFLVLLGVLVFLAGCTSVVDSLQRSILGITATPSPTATRTIRPVAKASTATPVPPTSSPTEVPPTVALESMTDEEIEKLFDAAEALTIRVYEKVSPSVVHITSQVIVMDFFGSTYPSEGTGSGFVIDKEGHIVTNYHVIEGAETIEVTLLDQTKVEAEVVGADLLNDLAVIHVDVDVDKLHPVDMSFNGEIKVGQRAIAIGNPFGLDWTLTSGVISSLGRPLQISSDQVLYNVVQTDAAINPGNSGGPLLNSRGQLIGVNSAMTAGAENIGFAIPLSTVRRVVPELIENGYYPHPWVGTRGYNVSPALARALELPVDEGMLIAIVDAGGPAEKAGLQEGTRDVVIGGRYRVRTGGDIIVEIDGVPIDGNAALREFLETRARVGQEVEITFYRGDKEMTTRLVLREQPR